MAEEGRNAENQAINTHGDRPGNILSKQRNTRCFALLLAKQNEEF